MLGVATRNPSFAPKSKAFAVLHQETLRLQHGRRCFVDHQNQDKQGVVKPLISIPYQRKPNEAGANFCLLSGFFFY